MIKIRGLQDFGTWLRKGEIVVVNNNLGLFVIQKGYAEIVREDVIVDDKRTKNIEEQLKLLEKYGLNPLSQSYGRTDILKLLRKLEKEKKE